MLCAICSSAAFFCSVLARAMARLAARAHWPMDCISVEISVLLSMILTLKRKLTAKA
jgi:hypothetical protein